MKRKMKRTIDFKFWNWRNPGHTRIAGSVCSIFSIFFLAANLVATPVSAASDSAPSGYSQDAGPAEVSDPFEGLNRVMFFIGDGLDTMFLRPISVAYTTFIPKPIRTGVDNFMSNVATPVTLSNDLFQGEWERAGTTAKRFLINSTVGIGGLLDVAAKQGLPGHTEDFGQTLAVHGVGSGPYLFIPILGPATPRHLAGRFVDLFTDPWTYILFKKPTLVRLAPTAVVSISARGDADAALTSIKETSPDYYSSIKNLYSQSRRNAINNGRVDDNDLVDIPEFDSR